MRFDGHEQRALNIQFYSIKNIIQLIIASSAFDGIIHSTSQRSATQQQQETKTEKSFYGHIKEIHEIYGKISKQEP